MNSSYTAAKFVEQMRRYGKARSATIHSGETVNLKEVEEAEALKKAAASAAIHTGERL